MSQEDRNRDERDEYCGNRTRHLHACLRHGLLLRLVDCPRRTVENWPVAYTRELGGMTKILSSVSEVPWPSRTGPARAESTFPRGAVLPVLVISGSVFSSTRPPKEKTRCDPS